MTVGSATGPSSYIATEFMALESDKWSTGPEYPFHSKISGYSTAETSLSSYIIGDGDPRTVRPSTIRQVCGSLIKVAEMDLKE